MSHNTTAQREPFIANFGIFNTLPQDGYALDFAQLPEAVWQRAQLIYVCSPGNPTGRVMPLAEWRTLFEMSDRYGFVIASDECYSEIYFGEEKTLGALQAAQQPGRSDYRNLVVFSSLSKRSNVPGMRSGFVAGDAAVIAKFTLYRTYHGSAMNPAIQAASTAACMRRNSPGCWRYSSRCCQLPCPMPASTSG